MKKFSFPGAYTFGIPSLCCPMNTPAMLWAHKRSKGSKKHVTDSPRNSTLFKSSRWLLSLTLYAKNHNVVPAGGTVIHHNIRGPDFPLFLSTFSLHSAFTVVLLRKSTTTPGTIWKYTSVFWPLQEKFLNLLQRWGVFFFFFLKMGSFTWAKQDHTFPTRDLTQELEHLMKNNRKITQPSLTRQP